MKQEDHELLSHTGRGTPLGTLLRRFWAPVVLSEELPKAGGRQVRVRVMGEDLVAFRMPSGEVGLVAEYCSHRGASLYFGRVEEGGIRCSYHGWKYDREGACLDTPNEPAGSKLKLHVCHKGYACVEQNGVVWAYMGPPGSKPALPDLEFLMVASANVVVTKRIQLAYWMQCQEADVDSSHVPFLHEFELLERLKAREADYQSAKWVMDQRAPNISVKDTRYGLVLGSRRNTGDGRHYWRINHWLMPWFTLIPANTGNGPLAGHAWVPVDDHQTMVFTFTWHPTRALTPAEIEAKKGGDKDNTALIEGTFIPRANKSNEYATDPNYRPDAQPWERMITVQEQDMAVVESMSPTGLFDRTQEFLGMSDIGIVQIRKRLLAALRGDQSAEGLGADPGSYRVRQFSTVLPEADVGAWTERLAAQLIADPESFEPSA